MDKIGGGNLKESIITITGDKEGWASGQWHMTIDLQEITNSAGKRVKDNYNGGTFVDYPLARAKRLLKLIRKHGTTEDIEKCEKYFKHNSRLYDIWKKVTA